jgi:TolB-like protein/Tfp pilus assembly protein PilF
MDGSTRAVITDFGLARRPDTTQAPQLESTRGGTPDYMAPELWKGDQPTGASDIYALGVILYELISGHRPFAPASPVDNRRFKPTRVDANWDGLLARCLVADPERRVKSADDVAVALRGHPRRRFLLGILACGASGTILWTWTSRRGPWRVTNRSVAVIPFANTQGSPETEYLSDGISESLTNALARVTDVKVVARTSSARFKGKDADLRAASRALGVQALVTGGVSEANGNLIIAVELVNGSDGTQIWGARYSTTVAGLRQVETEIVREVSRRIGSTLSDFDWTRLAAGMKIKPEAYGLLLQGRYHMQLYTPESRQKAVAYYQQALAIDPGSALAHAELARSYRLLGGSAVADPAEVLPRAEAASRRALAIDRDSADAHAALADIKKDQWDWTAAEFEYRRAIELNPNLANAHQGFAIYLSVMHRFASAEQAIQRAVELDPLGLPTAIHKAAVSCNARRFKDALQTLSRASELDPSATSPWAWTGMAHAGLGNFVAAIAAYERAVALGDKTAATQCYYAYALAAAGDRARPVEIIGRIQRSNGYVPRCALAVVYAGLNQKERAIQVLRDAYATKDPFLQYLNVDSHYDRLHSDPRFQDICARVGLPPRNSA